MKCPHCTINFHENWQIVRMERHNETIGWSYRTAHCPECDEVTIEISETRWSTAQQKYIFAGWTQFCPFGSDRGPVPAEVPQGIAEDYIKACQVLPISPKASAALSRLCLQTILRAHGYRDRDLAREIDLLLNETDASKAIPGTPRVAIDGSAISGIFPPIQSMTSPRFRSSM
jgi:hypothetical protein